MLVLTRKPRQQIMIGDNIVVNVVEVQGERRLLPNDMPILNIATVVEVQGDNVRIAIEAPREVKIYRGEIYRAIQEENKKAAVPLENVDLSLLPKK